MAGHGNAGWLSRERAANSGERNSDGPLEANEYNVAVDEVSYRDGYDSMAMFATRFDGVTLMDCKVKVVLLFAFRADR